MSSDALAQLILNCNDHDQKQLGWERVYFILHFHGQCVRRGVRAGTWMQEPKQRARRNAVHWLTLHGLLSRLRYITRTTSLEVAQPQWIGPSHISR